MYAIDPESSPIIRTHNLVVNFPGSASHNDATFLYLEYGTPGFEFSDPGEWEQETIDYLREYTYLTGITTAVLFDIPEAVMFEVQSWHNK